MGSTNLKGWGIDCYKCFSEGKSCDHTISLQTCHGCKKPLVRVAAVNVGFGTIDGEFYCFDCMTNEQIRWSEQTIGLTNYG